MNDEMKFDKEEMSIIHDAMTMYLALTNLEVSRHKMYKDTSMDRLFEKMEHYATAGVVWVKIAKAMGVPQEEIARYLEEVEK